MHMHVHTCHTPDLNAREGMVVDVVLFQDSTSIVIEVDSHLLSAVDTIMSQDWLTACNDHIKQKVVIVTHTCIPKQLNFLLS